MIWRKRFKVPPIETVIGEGAEISGHIRFSHGMHVDGRVNGDIEGLGDTRATLVVSQAGHIKGNVHTENLILDGTIEGDVFACGRVELAPAARVTGTVYYQYLAMAMGAEVNGELVHKDDMNKHCSGVSADLSEKTNSE